MGGRDDPLGQIEEGSTGAGLVSELQECRASTEAGLCDRERLEPTRAADLCVDDGVKDGDSENRFPLPASGFPLLLARSLTLADSNYAAGIGFVTQPRPSVSSVFSAGSDFLTPLPSTVPAFSP
jgi:hypothetical protein